MGDIDENAGLNKLAQVMQSRITRNQEAHGDLILDFGTIQQDMSLKTNTFSIPIPQKDYHVLRQITLGKTGSYLTSTISPGNKGDGTHSHGSSGAHGGHTGGDGTHTHSNEGPHVHTVLVPEKMRSIKPGDRVLVAWVQSEAVVLDIILPATAV